MESKDYRRRANAHNALERLGPLVYAIPLPSGVESRRRVSQLKGKWYRRNAEWIADRVPWKSLPWIWRNGYTGPRTNQWFSAVPSHVKDGKDYYRWRYATRLWLTYQIRAERSWKAITKDLNAMKQAEADWKRTRKRED